MGRFMFLKEDNNRPGKIIGIAIFLFITILAVYQQTGSHEFISLDDPDYITGNPFVRQGLTADSISWAFTAFHSSNWHPLTWLSHMLDVELFGINPTGHHMTNIALHYLNSLLLLLMLHRFTGLIWRSAIVAGLFALHPLHVESVAWISERKDVLSTLFWMATIYFYASYVQKPQFSRYALMLAAYVLGLMSKPMLVTLPLILLMLDYWPLKRLESDRSMPEWKVIRHIIIEKIPLFLLAALSCAVTIKAQQSATTSLAITPLVARISNAFLAYATYLLKTVFPTDLAVFYPFHSTLPLWQVSCSTVLLIVISVIAIRERRRRPYLIVGWLWYLVTLLPVIGIVRVGLQAMADRYTYIPLIGIFIIAVWGGAEVSASWPRRRIVLTILTCAIFSICALTAWRQASYWKNTKTLFSRALATTKGNYFAHYNLALGFASEGNFFEAVSGFEEALSINPYYVPAYLGLGDIFKRTGRLGESADYYQSALMLTPTAININYQLGSIYYTLGRLNEAADHFYKELALNPDFAECHNILGQTLADRGKRDEAISHFKQAVSIKPDYIEARKNLDRILSSKKAQ